MARISLNSLQVVSVICVVELLAACYGTSILDAYDGDARPMEAAERFANAAESEKLQSDNETVVRTQPEQIHISATGNVTEMMVTWSTFDPTATSTVEYGLTCGGDKLNLVAVGMATKFVDGGLLRHTQYIHRVKLTGLKPGESYIYHCGSTDGWSELFFFSAIPAGVDWGPRFAFYGDMGNENAQSLARLQQETQKGMYDAILHVGDFAYDFASNNGTIGDNFMRQIEAVGGYIPYMTCPGNHEYHYNFSNYKNRFTMPNYEETQNLWYSWNIGPVHIVSVSTEVYFFQTDLIPNQLKWLTADLKEANDPKNRSERPWIITMGHRPAYCTNDNNNDCTLNESIIRKAFEDIFYQNGVDVEFWAHEHSYERMWPLYNRKVYNGSLEEPYTNPKAPVHIVTGSAGCRERHNGFGHTEPWDGFRSDDYGYTRVNVLNSTHINIEQVSDDKDGAVIDHFTLIKDKHGFEAWL